MISPPVLTMSNFSRDFVLKVDASGDGVGAVLMQNQRPIAYFSKLLRSRLQQKSIYEKEIIAICLEVQKWKHYLLGRHFIVRSDQQSLWFLTQEREVNPDYQMWVTKLLGFDFDIQFKPGSSNRVVDALSRKQGGEITLNSLCSGPVVCWDELEQEIARDTDINKIIRELKERVKLHEGFVVLGSKLLYKGRVVIPRKSTMVPKLLRE